VVPVSAVRALRTRRAAVSLLILVLGYGLLSAPALRVWRFQAFLPSYGALVASYGFLVTSGALWQGVLASLERILMGYALGAVMGIVVGSAMGGIRQCDAILEPLVQVVRFTPALAWLPLYMIWFGTGQTSMIMLIATGVSVVTLTATYHGVRDVPDVYLKAARVLGAGRLFRWRRVVLPAALPQVFDGLRVAIAVAWAIIVAAELIGAPSGLGALLVNAREYLNIPLVLVVIAHIGVLASLMDLLGRRLHRRATAWMRRREAT
jgi:ABC-type nitrate/sulfonate/bicarbonate transport system permease component